MEYIFDYLNPALIPVAIALWIIGKFIKESKIKDELIPAMLVPCGIGLVGLWLLSQGIPAGVGEWLVLAVNALVQGLICAALATWGDQLGKQAQKLKEPTVTITQAEFEGIAEVMGVSPKELQAVLDAAKATTSR